MQAVMEVATPRGHLRTLTGEPITVSDLARLVGETPAVVKRLLERLATAKVYELQGGVAVDIDMVRRSDISAKRSESGRKGAERTNRQRLRHPVQQMPQQNDSGTRQQTSVAEATAAPSAAPLVNSGSSSSAVDPSTTTTSTVRVREDDAESERRNTLLARFQKWDRLSTLIGKLPDPTNDADLVYAFLVKVAIRVGESSVSGWVSRFEQSINPDGMGYRPVPPNVFAAALANFVAFGELDKPDKPEPQHFQSFVERMRDQGDTARIHRGTAGMRPRAGAPGIASKATKEYDTSGNTGAADALKRQLEG